MPLLLPELVLPLFAVMGALVLIGLAHTATSVHGSGESQGFWATIKAQLGVQQISSLAAKFFRYVVSRFAHAQLHAVGHWLKGLGTLVLGSYAIQAGYAEDTEKALQRLFVDGDPKARRAAHKAQSSATHAGTVAHRAEAAAHAGRKALTRYEAQTNTRVHHLTHAVDVAIPSDIAGLRERNKALEKARTKDESRIRAVEDGAIDTFKWLNAHRLSAAMGVFSGAVALALSRLGFGFLRCRSWQNVGKRMTCGMGSSLLNLLDGGLGDLLGVLLTVEATANFRELVKLGQEVEHEVAVGIKDVLNV